MWIFGVLSSWNIQKFYKNKIQKWKFRLKNSFQERTEDKTEKINILCEFIGEKTYIKLREIKNIYKYFYGITL